MAVGTAWGEAAKHMADQCRGLAGRAIAITQVGAGRRRHGAGLVELAIGKGVMVQADTETGELPATVMTSFDELDALPDWALVNVAGHVLEVSSEELRVVDGTGLGVRLRTEQASAMGSVSEGDYLEVLMAQKSTRYANLACTPFTEVKVVGEKGILPEKLPRRVAFAM